MDLAQRTWCLLVALRSSCLDVKNALTWRCAGEPEASSHLQVRSTKLAHWAMPGRCVRRTRVALPGAHGLKRHIHMTGSIVLSLVVHRLRSRAF